MAKDLPKNALPVFKPSGQGVGKDFIGLQKQKIMAEGWWAGQLRAAMDKKWGKTREKGILCYKYKTRIGKEICQKHEPTIDLLELIGFNDANLNKICRSYKNDGVSQIQLRLGMNTDGREVEDFEKAIDALRRDLPQFEKLTLENTVTVRHGKPFGPIAIHQSFNIAQEGIDSQPFNINQAKLKLYDINGVDVTSKMGDDAALALTSLLWISGNGLLDFKSKTMTKAYEYQEMTFGGDMDYLGIPPTYETWGKVTTLEEYGHTFVNDYAKNNAKKFEITDYSEDCYGSFCMPGDLDVYIPFFAGLIWNYYSSKLAGTGDGKDDGLFINGSLRIDKFNALSPADLKEFVSKGFSVYVKQKKGKWHSKISKLVGMVLGRITAITYYLPPVKASMQAIMWGLNGGHSWGISRRDYMNQGKVIVMVAISIIVSVLTGGQATPAMKAFSTAMQALNIYNGVQSIEEMRDSAEYAEAMEKLSEKERIAMEEALEEENMSTEVGEGGIDDSIFMPLDRDMEDMELPMFAEGSELELKFTEGISNEI